MAYQQVQQVEESDPPVRVLTKEEIEDCRLVFKQLDKDGDGSITAKELGEVLRKICKKKITDSEIEGIIQEKDADGNGTLDFEEFLTAMTCERKDHDESDIAEFRDAFKVFDRDGNGLITPEELYYTMDRLGQKVSRADVAQMIAEFDEDKDGQINFEEFVHMMRSKK